MTTMQLEEPRRGRPPKDQETRRRRKVRDDGEVIGTRLAVNKSLLDFDSFVYRWINDVPARLRAKTIEDDWDIVRNDGGVKDDNADLGNAVMQIVGTKPDGSALTAYLCRKPKKFYDEDQAQKTAELDKQLQELRRGNDRSGGLQGDYIPHSGIRLG